MNGARHKEDAACAEPFVQSSADEITGGAGCGPYNIVYANRFLEPDRRFSFAGDRFKCGPCKTHAQRPKDQEDNLAGQRLHHTAKKPAADEHCESHYKKSQSQSDEITSPLREFSGQPHRDAINSPADGAQRKVTQIGETKLVAHVKKDVIEVDGGGEGVQSFENERPPLYQR